MSADCAATAAIVVIGDEILSGKVEEQNARFLVRQLRELGVAVRRIEVIPDLPEVIAAAVRAAARAYDHVFTSGGIGPTHDDVTIPAIAAAFEVAVVRNPELADLIRAAMVDEFHERNLRMADVPEGAALVRGPAASAKCWPVIAMRNVYILPGVPSILQRKFAMIRERFRASPFFTHSVYSAAGEGAIAEMLDQAAADFPTVAIGSYPHLDAPDHKVLITLDGRDRDLVERARAQIVAGLGQAMVRVE
ncbi:MAG: molybdopterin-binding protein [Polyangia bacterium]|jgi:molybdenum cofactor synthesis domain-containing protein